MYREAQRRGVVPDLSQCCSFLNLGDKFQCFGLQHIVDGPVDKIATEAPQSLKKNRARELVKIHKSFDITSRITCRYIPSDKESFSPNT